MVLIDIEKLLSIIKDQKEYKIDGQVLDYIELYLQVRLDINKEEQIEEEIKSDLKDIEPPTRFKQRTRGKDSADECKRKVMKAIRACTRNQTTMELSKSAELTYARTYTILIELENERKVEHEKPKGSGNRWYWKIKSHKIDKTSPFLNPKLTIYDKPIIKGELHP